MADGEESRGGAAQIPPPPFSFPIFRYIWIANLVSNFGSLVQSVGAAWLMTSLTPSPVMVTLVQASTTFPIMLFSLVAGAIADNLDRRKVMIAAQAFMLVASVGLVAFAWSGLLTPWLLLTFTFLIGCGVAVNSPSWSASISDMVPRPTVPAAVALNSMGFNIARSVGPAIGGLIVASAGAAAAFVMNTVSYFGLIGVLLRWKPDYPRSSLPRESLGAAMRGGLRYVTMSPHLRVVMVRAAFFGIFASAVSALMPLIARDLIRGSAGLYGLLSAAFGVGAVGGALLTSRIRHRFGPEAVLRIAALALAAGTAVTGASSNALLTTVAVLVSGAGWVLGFSSFNILVQLASPRWVAGRALACYQMAAFGAMAVGSWIIGAMTADFGVSDTLFLLALLQAANVLLGLVLPLAEVGTLDLDPLLQNFDPVTQVPVKPRSGPVVISIAYRIAAENVPAFLAAMLERRRIRRRDGASGWVLMRDLGDAERWIERYDLPTWVDYVRHTQRHTREDAVSWEHVLSLHAGPERPVITRLLERQPSPPQTDPVAEPIEDPTRVI